VIEGGVELAGRSLSSLADSGAAGTILLTADGTEHLEAVFGLKISGLPIVLVRRAVLGLRVDVVESDHRQGAYLATEYLLKHGHRRVLMMTRKAAPTSANARVWGYEQALVDHGVVPVQAWKIWIDETVTAQGHLGDDRLKVKPGWSTPSGAVQ